MRLRRPREGAERSQREGRKAAARRVLKGGRNEKRQPPAEETGRPSAGRIVAVLRGAAKLIVLAAATAAAIWGGLLAYGHATSAEYFAVDDVAVEGARRLTREEVLATAGFVAGMNVFRVDTDAMATALQEHPWVLEAQVRRRIPRSISFEISERRPEALVLFDAPYLVDDTGEVFKRWALGDPVLAPVITGFTREQAVLDGENVAEGVREAIAFARRYRAAGLERVAPLAEVHREVDGGFTVCAGEDPFRVRFGAGPYRRKLARLATLLERMGRDGLRPAVIFLDNEVRPDRVTVKVKVEAASLMEARVELDGGAGKKQSKI
jgi:cell division protein FtsQ